jgi:hypothetical protein
MRHPAADMGTVLTWTRNAFLDWDIKRITSRLSPIFVPDFHDANGPEVWYGVPMSRRGYKYLKQHEAAESNPTPQQQVETIAEERQEFLNTFGIKAFNRATNNNDVVTVCYFGSCFPVTPRVHYGKQQAAGTVGK